MQSSKYVALGRNNFKSWACERVAFSDERRFTRNQESRQTYRGRSL